MPALEPRHGPRGRASTMRAAFVDAPGAADTIRVGPLPMPTPGPTDALVAVWATAVDHVDTYIRAGRYPTPLPFPFVVGRDLVGTVVEAGAGAGVAVGDGVWCNSLGHDGRQGACAEYAVVPGDRLYPLPARIEPPPDIGSAAGPRRDSQSHTDPRVDPIAMVAVVHNAATAWLGLHRRARVRPGDTVFVGGAAGNLGSVVAQFAAEAGLRVLASAGPADHDRCRRLGAREVFDYRDPDLGVRLREAAPGGVDVWWDTSGRADLGLGVDALAPGGRMLLTAHAGADPVLPASRLYASDRSIVGFVISRATVPEMADAARAIDRRLAGPGLAVRVTRVVGLDGTSDAHAAVEGGIPGRIAVVPRW